MKLSDFKTESRIVFYLALVTSVVAAEGRSRNGKFLFGPLIVTDSYDTRCTGTNGLYGICTSALACIFGGSGSQISGSCDSGLQVCCTYIVNSCGATFSRNTTTIVNPITSSNSQTCQYNVMRSANVCKVRLDFLEFDLTQPNSESGSSKNGKCLNDKMRVTGGKVMDNFEDLCGKMPPEWHFNIEVRDVDVGTPTTIEFIVDGAVTHVRKWKVVVTQVPCSLNIPAGCGQYFTGYTGKVYSFNWGNNVYLHGFSYAICVRREKDVCSYNIYDRGLRSEITCPDVIHFPSDYYDVSPNKYYCRLPIPPTVPGPVFPGSLRPVEYTMSYRAPLWFTHYTKTTNIIRNRDYRSAGLINGFFYEWEAKKC